MFFDSLRRIGAELAGCEAFADHQPYDGATTERLAVAAAAADAQLVTTAKDAARLGPAAPSGLAVLDVALVWDDKDGLVHLLERLPLPSPRASIPSPRPDDPPGPQESPPAQGPAQPTPRRGCIAAVPAHWPLLAAYL